MTGGQLAPEAILDSKQGLNDEMWQVVDDMHGDPATSRTVGQLVGEVDPITVVSPAGSDQTQLHGSQATVGGLMSAEDIDRYLAGVEEPKRATLSELRQTILGVVPDAEQGISYGVPAFKIRGKTIAGFAAFKHHLSYLPHSGSVFPELGDDLAGYSMSSGALRFDIDKPLPKELVAKLIAVRLRQAFPD